MPPTYSYEKQLQIINALMLNGDYETANEKIKEWKIKMEIRNGELIDMSDSTEAWLRRFITVDSQMVALKGKVKKLSKIEDEVLISGETGTGKELIAHALHGDRNGKFVGVNCAGIPEQLVESLLFGHVKGSFTGATDTRQGFIQLAKDGTLFLDEVGELPLMTQGKFLRAIQERRIMKVGGDKEEEIACRFIFASHRDLPKMVAAQQFRIDLYARISTFELHISRLMDRGNDIIPIVESMEGGKELVEIMHNKHKNWSTPLNVRSLQQAVKRWKVLGELPE